MPKDIKEIDNKKQIRLGWTAFFILFTHFSLIVLSIIPNTQFTADATALSKRYTDPIFRQSWDMFAPCPILENRLMVKYYFEDDSTDWIDPITTVLSIHQTYRFTYHGNIAVGYYNMLYWFKIELDNFKVEPNINQSFSSLPKLRNSLGNRLLHKYVFGYARQQFAKKPLKTDLKISYRDIVSEKTTQYLLSDYK